MSTQNESQKAIYITADKIEESPIMPSAYETTQIFIGRYTVIGDRDNYIGSGEVWKINTETNRTAGPYPVCIPSIHFEENNAENCKMILSTTVDPETNRYVFNIYNPTSQRIRLGIFTLEEMHSFEAKSVPNP
ncbi:MAG: hypothetical protein LUF85_04620 [Bacteroides sp.]|nr:hypothetical protein [Bacteroides sp.]